MSNPAREYEEAPDQPSPTMGLDGCETFCYFRTLSKQEVAVGAILYRGDPFLPLLSAPAS